MDYTDFVQDIHSSRREAEEARRQERISVEEFVREDLRVILFLNDDVWEQDIMEAA